MTSSRWAKQNKLNVIFESSLSLIMNFQGLVFNLTYPLFVCTIWLLGVCFYSGLTDEIRIYRRSSGP